MGWAVKPLLCFQKTINRNGRVQRVTFLGGFSSTATHLLMQEELGTPSRCGLAWHRHSHCHTSTAGHGRERYFRRKTSQEVLGGCREDHRGSADGVQQELGDEGSFIYTRLLLETKRQAALLSSALPKACLSISNFSPLFNAPNSHAKAPNTALCVTLKSESWH